MRIEIREYLEHQPNGDRATSLSPSSKFEVWQILENREVKLHTFNQFNANGLFGPSVGKRQETIDKAEKYAEKFGVPVKHRRFREKAVPRKKEWTEI